MRMMKAKKLIKEACIAKVERVVRGAKIPEWVMIQPDLSAHVKQAQHDDFMCLTTEGSVRRVTSSEDLYTAIEMIYGL